MKHPENINREGEYRVKPRLFIFYSELQDLSHWLTSRTAHQLSTHILLLLSSFLLSIGCFYPSTTFTLKVVTVFAETFEGLQITRLGRSKTLDTGLGN
jgi:hypothetical protein